MIQRLQSVYLLLTAILSGLFLSGDFIRFINADSAEIIVRFDGIFRLSGETKLTQMRTIYPVSIISILIPGFSLATIFFFRNRKLQEKLALVLLSLEVLLVAGLIYFMFMIEQKDRNSPEIGFFTFIPLLTIVLTILACSRIRKDELLVRSYDRMR